MAEYVFKIDGEIKACYSDVYSQDGYCPFHFYAFNSGSHCSISNCKCTKTKRPEGCLLKELKAHGRLIDEADLRKRAYELQRSDRCTFPEALALALISAPTVLEANK